MLEAPEVAWPLTRPMCSPIGDGAAAAIVCSEEFARKIGADHGVEVAACVLASGEDREHEMEESTLARLAKKAYEKAGVGPEDVNVAEVHDATAMGEIVRNRRTRVLPHRRGRALCRGGQHDARAARCR